MPEKEQAGPVPIRRKGGIPPPDAMVNVLNSFVEPRGDGTWIAWLEPVERPGERVMPAFAPDPELARVALGGKVLDHLQQLDDDAEQAFYAEFVGFKVLKRRIPPRDDWPPTGKWSNLDFEPLPE